MSVNLNVNTLKSSLSKVERGVNFVDFEAEVILIGAGGRGGLSSASDIPNRVSNTGGAGSFLSASYTIPATSSLRIDVGQGGTGSLVDTTYYISRAEDTKISYYNPNTTTYEDRFIARGGGAGESDPISELSPTITQFVYAENPVEGFTVFDGGSGGGVYATASNQTPKTPIGQPMPVVIPEGEVLGFAFTGSKGGGGDLGSVGFRQRTYAGGGGALNSGSSAVSTNVYPAGAGQGINWDDTFVSGAIANVVAKGISVDLQSGEAGYGGTPNTGNGGGISGSSGIVAIKYFGEQKIFGDAGEVITQEDYTIHIFTGSADITTTGKTYSGSDVDIPVPQIPVEAIILGGGGGYGDDPNPDVSGGTGGGASAAVSASFIMGRNVTFDIHIGSGGLVDTDGESSYLYGYTDSTLETYSTASTQLTMSAYGGKCGESSSFGNGGNSGEGYYILDETIQYYPSFSGGFGYANFTGSNNIRHGGGGASNTQNGENASFERPGRVVLGIGTTIVENSTIPYEGVTADLSSNKGGGATGDGSNTWGDGGTYDKNNGRPGLCIFRYSQYFDRYDIQVTGNVTSSLRNGSRIHQFNIGDGTIRLSYSPTGST